MFVNYLVYFFVFAFGLCAGSFLNCVIYRLALPNFSFWKNLGGLSRSYCPKCKKQLKRRDLVPVFSFLFLRGQCRYCRKKISPQYPLVELSTGVLFVLIFWFCVTPGVTPSLCFLFFISCFLIVIFVYDLKHYLIPDKILLPAIAIVFIYRIFEFLNLEFVSDFGFRISDFKYLFNYFIAVILVSGFFLIIFLVSRGKWMGFGDVKLAILMGLLLGLPDIFVALFLAFFFGAIIGLILMVFEKKNLKSEVPFAPFLITGTFIAMLYGNQIIQWYLNFFKI